LLIVYRLLVIAYWRDRTPGAELFLFLFLFLVLLIAAEDCHAKSAKDAKESGIQLGHFAIGR
jgi:hypothetical protein